MNKTRSILAALGVFLLTKLKTVIALLKFSKFGVTFLSMAISLWAYAMRDGWSFAVALVYLIFVHEMGHVIASKMKGIKTSPTIFIPFVGAFGAMKDRPKNASTESFIAYAGPLAGLISFLPAIPLYLWTEDPTWVMVIFLGAIINLFNLLPISPLDGGRIVSVLSSKIWFFGLLALGILLIFTPEPMLFLLFFLGLFSWYNRSREGYQEQILTYEKQHVERLIAEMHTWPTLDSESLFEKRAQYSGNVAPTYAKPEHKKSFYLPFIHDEQRLSDEKQRMDRNYAAMIWEFYQQWERSPIAYVDGDPNQPMENLVLMNTIQEGETRLAKLNEQIHQLSTYYESPRSTKWKVLAAYILLALVLSAFALYSHNLMQMYR